MGYRCFEVEEEGGVAHLRMSRPEEYNSMIREFWIELPEIVGRLDDAGKTRAIVISSTGKHFCAGLDLTLLSGGDSSGQFDLSRARASSRETVLALQENLTCLEKARMPVLVAVQGGCIGGGIDLSTACDMRYCSEDAFFCVQEINVGLAADVGTLQRLPKVIPEGHAREMAYTGRRMNSTWARDVGLVNAVYPDHASLVEGVLEIAGEIAERSPLAMWGSKEMLNFARDHSVAEGLNYVATWQAGMFHGEDTKEAFEARQEKRKAEYADLPPRSKGFSS
ncbi:MAG: enoyl-CoA hydratase [Spirochaeta sp.]|nr:enoyl-CoA hydratase [Spirochaeta sp.]RPG05304.1 MAG: crotonase/enoyl-CoA hydratase family protein [Proteobacteria bacterium TMED72]